MTHPHSSAASDTDIRRPCVSCGTSLPLSEPILVKFRRCYYCGRHHPFGSIWKGPAAPVAIAAAIGLIAIFWSQLPS